MESWTTLSDGGAIHLHGHMPMFESVNNNSKKVADLTVTMIARQWSEKSLPGGASVLWQLQRQEIVFQLQERPHLQYKRRM